ncbi:hypothetical protein [Tateyamaria sp.]|uniref:hypothetical protein n=1 Tax=Tateyamaria sp. TaxID=1929288 RepID=UPI00329D7AB3
MAQDNTFGMNAAFQERDAGIETLIGQAISLHLQPLLAEASNPAPVIATDVFLPRTSNEIRWQTDGELAAKLEADVVGFCAKRQRLLGLP